LENLSDEAKALLTDEDWVKGYETNAGNAQATQKLMDGLKAYGINTIRIPIAWSNMMTEETQADGTIFYKINDAYFNRVEEIMNYCLNDEMYVIINIHWDNGWWGMFGDADESVRAQAQKRYEDFWTQIAERYKEYSDNVIFEGANEELGERLNDDWKGSSSQFSFTSCTPGQGGYGVLTKEECYAKVKELNQKFVDIVRSSGGNNADRFLLIPGFNTNIHDTCSDDFSMPQDLAQNGTDKLFVSIHYYDPIGWGIAKSASQGYDGYADTWGSDADYQYMWDDFAEAKAAFTDKGYGIIFGEFGVLSVNKDGVPEYCKEFFENCVKYGMVPVMWDEGTYVDRKGTGNRGVSYFVYEDIGNVFCEVTGSTVTLRSDAQKNLTNTGIPQSLISSNQDPLVVATWEGDFMRNTGAGDLQQAAVFANYDDPEDFWPSDRDYGGIFRTNSININEAYEGLTLAVTCAEKFWHEHFELSDWSALKRPSVRITVHDDDVSKTAQLQLVYSDGDPENGAAWRYETDCEQVEWETGVAEDGSSTQVAKTDENGDYVLADSAWIGKTLELNTEYLERYPVVLLTTNTYMGVDFVKVEICDAAYNSDGTEFEETAE
jgi:aryl-phospho-beta-D-glucosidase BglC (GH1 family)